MLRLRGILGIAVLLVPLAAQAQSDAALWRFVYPNAKALISIDWARIRQSQAGAMLRDKWLAASGNQAPEIPGMEMLDDIDRILISSSGNKSPNDTEQPPVLIAVHGRFEAAKVRDVFKRLDLKPQTYNSFQVYRPQGKQGKDMACVLVDGATLLLGDAASVFAALDRNQFRAGASPAEAPAPGSIAARAADMEASYDFWVIMDATEIMTNDTVAALFKGGEWASEARGFEAGFSLRAGLAADVTLRFASDATAKRMTTELSRLLNVAAKDKTSGPPLQDIAKRLKFNVDGSAAKISLRLTQQDLEKNVQAYAEYHKANARKADSVAITAAPVPAKPGVIRIEGLDDGPREIPFPAASHDTTLQH